MIPFWGAFLAGLVGSPHCIGMCGAFCTAASSRPGGQALWHAGRLTTYAVLGALAGLAGGAVGVLGTAIPGAAWLPQVVAAILLVWFALALAGVVREPHFRLPGLTKLGARVAGGTTLGSRYAFGLATGLLPCGLVYAALALPVALGSPAVGALAMVAFGLGTVPVLSMLSAVIQRTLRRGLWPRRILALLVLATGLWAVWARRPGAPTPPAHQHEVPAPGQEHHR